MYQSIWWFLSHPTPHLSHQEGGRGRTEREQGAGKEGASLSDAFSPDTSKNAESLHLVCPDKTKHLPALSPCCTKTAEIMQRGFIVKEIFGLIFLLLLLVFDFFKVCAFLTMSKEKGEDEGVWVRKSYDVVHCVFSRKSFAWGCIRTINCVHLSCPKGKCL